jgi:hypothetical protein
VVRTGRIRHEGSALELSRSDLVRKAFLGGI